MQLSLGNPFVPGRRMPVTNESSGRAMSGRLDQRLDCLRTVKEMRIDHKIGNYD